MNMHPVCNDTWQSHAVVEVVHILQSSTPDVTVDLSIVEENCRAIQR